MGSNEGRDGNAPVGVLALAGIEAENGRERIMTLLGNIVWFLFGGVWAAIGYILGGVGLCITIIGIPFGVQSFKLAVAVLAPFGKEVVPAPDANSPLRVLFNILWIILFGWEIALTHLLLALLLGITIIGIPFAVQNIKLIPLALLPFGRDLVEARPLHDRT